MHALRLRGAGRVVGMTAAGNRELYLRMMLENPDDPRHGTNKGYNYGCRCERCEKAGRDYRRENEFRLRTAANRSHAKALLEMIDDQGDRRHGTRYGYSCGCRCERCREAERERKRGQGKGWHYSFPAHKDACSGMTREEMLSQTCKVFEEATELVDALNRDEGDDRVLEECLDTVHACETLLRSWPAEKVREARDKVVKKNRARSYYEK